MDEVQVCEFSTADGAYQHADAPEEGPTLVVPIACPLRLSTRTHRQCPCKKLVPVGSSGPNRPIRVSSCT